MPKCMCGAEAKVESILDIKAALLGRDPLKGRFRVICARCGEGICNIRGFRTRAEAVSAWERSMQIIVEQAEEFHVTPKEFIEKINSVGGRGLPI